MLADHPIYTSIPVSDLERATAWYRDKLGFEPSEDPPLPHGEEGIFFEAGAGTLFYLFPTRAAAGAGHTVAEFAVGDRFDEIIEELRGRGVTFEEYEIPGIKVEDAVAHFPPPQEHRAVWLKDSEGNVLAIGSYASGGGRP